MTRLLPRLPPLCRRLWLSLCLPLSGTHWRRSAHGLLLPLSTLVRSRTGRDLLGLLVSVPVFLLSALSWYLVGRIVTYGLFWGDGDHSDAWGGPTLLGAWVVHALIAFVLVAAAMSASVPLMRLHHRLTS
ncbi:hypothetical protein [Amycolatopsis aidingensis]|uniref:hypothetical protein n=1 Tax=Amycolatopsis aidingensis TaxID=2842453 RepID=UPI001C0CBFB7|nr:hypothetical protein [Amycolatopsis aidingensis]